MFSCSCRGRSAAVAGGTHPLPQSAGAIAEIQRSGYSIAMQIIDPVTQLPVGGPDLIPVRADAVPDEDAVASAVSSLILSASGWRKVFAADGNEESSTGDVAPEDLVLAAAMAESFALLLKKKNGPAPAGGTRRLSVALGIDARNTGPLLASMMVRVLLAEGLGVRYLFIAAAPEIMAYVRNTPELDGFIYISASHNPLGHNGVKFGFSDGGVIGGDDAAGLIESFRGIAADRDRLTAVCKKAEAVTPDAMETVFRSAVEWKKAAADSYRRFTRQVVSNSGEADGQERFFSALREASAPRPLGILGELNGSARGTSIDRDIFTEAGFETVLLNGRPRQIVHRIVPEGRSLDLCRAELARLAKETPSFQLGYVPDNDGDRGNLVYYDFEAEEARIIEAQEVFALAVLAELSFLSLSGGAPVDEAGRFTEKVAVAVNGPTSTRIDRIAGVFNAQVFRAEVGEANVVNLARRLRKEGYIVRILGEGSNGGNITHPSAVRDPLSTVFAAAKLLCLEGPFQLWLKVSGQSGGAGGNRTSLAGVLQSLPKFITTSAYEPEAIMRIGTTDHAVVKANYEKVFTAAWAKKKSELERKYGIVSWREINTEGTEERCGFGPDYRSGREKGGLKIEFFTAKGTGEAGSGNTRPAAYIWMRGSGTEPVFRVLADVEGDRREMERELLYWQREMIEAADKM